MEAFVGKWEFESATNQEALMDAVDMLALLPHQLSKEFQMSHGLAGECCQSKSTSQTSDKEKSQLNSQGMTDPQRRQMFLKIRPTWALEATPGGDQWTVTQSTPHRSVQYTFHLGEQFEHDTLDGRRMQTTITVDGGKIDEVHVDAVHPEASPYVTRELSADKMLCTMKIKGTESILTFSRVA